MCKRQPILFSCSILCLILMKLHSFGVNISSFVLPGGLWNHNRVSWRCNYILHWEKFEMYASIITRDHSLALWTVLPKILSLILSFPPKAFPWGLILGISVPLYSTCLPLWTVTSFIPYMFCLFILFINVMVLHIIGGGIHI